MEELMNGFVSIISIGVLVCSAFGNTRRFATATAGAHKRGHPSSYLFNM